MNIPFIPPGAPAPQTIISNNGAQLGLKSGGKVIALAPQFERAKLLQKTLRKNRIGLMATQALGSGNVICFLEEFTVPAHCDGFELTLQNAHPTSHPQVRVRICVSEIASPNLSAALNDVVLGGVSYASLGTPGANASLGNQWVNVTKNGVSPFQLTARAGSTVNNPHSNTLDPITLQTLPRNDPGRTAKVVKVIVEYAGYENGIATATNITVTQCNSGIIGWEQDTDITLPPYGNFWRSRSNTGSFCGVDPSLMTATTMGNSSGTYFSAPLEVAFTMSGAKGMQGIAIGDSELEGAGDLSMDKYSWLMESFQVESSASMPMELAVYAQAGSNTSAWTTMAAVVIPRYPNSFIFCPEGTPNSGTPLGTTVQSASIVNGGSGGTPGAVILTGTTGTGTPFQINATVGAGGSVTSLGALVVSGTTVLNGPYTVLPANINAEPVTGTGGLTGCVLSLNFIGSTLTLWERDMAFIRRLAEQYGCVLLPITQMPTNTSQHDFKGSDPMRIGRNNMRLNSGEPCLDADKVMAGVLAANNQVQMKVGYTDDNIHPNATGRVALRDQVGIPFLKKLGGI